MQTGIAVVVTLLILAVIAFLDYVTGPNLNPEAVYFVAIIYAAWKLGRKGSVPTAIIAEIPAYFDALYLIRTGQESLLVAISNVIVRLIIYLFVAEVTVRLLRSREQVQETADELRVAYDRLDDDVRAAGLLQASVLSFTPPKIQGCEVGACVRYAMEVGGDFADAGIIEGRVYACVADVSGKGVPAALFTTLFKYLLQDALDQGLHGKDVIVSLLAPLCGILPPEKFITLIYVEIDPDSGFMEYINAGHPEGLFYRNGVGSLELLEPTAPLLGHWVEPKDIGSVTLQMATGDVLTLFTDGAIESKARSGGRLGDSFIHDLVKEYAHIPAQEMVESICDRIEEAAEPDSRDDLALISVKKL